ncbi:MAG TPA: penicillin-binding transpeptidase domain-containing protein [Pyrinomonadaceae bacterium]|nr:penicillin-binding transpeptidase domain-containing protein [Pyrinomonadaceae bacterium]
MQRRLGRPLTKRERAAELRRVASRHRRGLLEARRRAEAARRAAIARQRAIDNALRNEVQAMIARDDLTGEDPEVRRIAVNALGNHAGTVVVMDPMTGRVYSVVNQEWALRRGFKPCSTIKLVTGVAGLSENAIPMVDTVGDGYRIDLTSALAHSDNPFFQQVGTKIGSEKMVSYARQLGLGEKTGLNVPFEFPGRLPEIKSGNIERRMFSHADGFEVTPLQLGTLVSAMANGGRLLQPQIPHSPKEAAKMSPKVRRQLDITSDVWHRMVPGMVGAVNYGSGRKAYDPTQTVAGKTGTCIGDGGWVGLFTSYAPLANPRLAVVVIAQGTDGRRHFPAAVAGEIYRGLNHRFGTAINLQVASTLDDEEKEVADAEEAAEQTADSMAAETPETSSAVPNVTPSSTTAPGAKPAAKTDTPELRSPVKRVLMPLEKKPETQKSTQPVKTPGATAPAEQQRPRRIQP